MPYEAPSFVKFKPDSIEGWQRFWMAVLGTFVIAGSSLAANPVLHFLKPSVGENIRGILLLATFVVGIYSWILLRCGRFLLALVGFGIVLIGALLNIPTL